MMNVFFVKGDGTMEQRALAMGLAIAVSMIGPVHAGEGMWTPQQLPEIAEPLAQAGLKLPVEQLANLTGEPMGAVVALGGCTASFVSPQGLVVTNHHCAYGAIQLNSTSEKNLITQGFYAATFADELSAGPTARVYVLEDIMDVTQAARQAIVTAGHRPLARSQALARFRKQQVAQCEQTPGYRCQFFSFDGGNVYRIYKNLEIQDVRLAYAPPDSVGKFGGDVDNWMWPRHTGDFSFYRAYVNRQGKPALFAKDNIPYRPKHWLRLATDPLRDGDFVMIAGYPGRTNRYALLSEFDQAANWLYPHVSQDLKRLIDLVDVAGKKNPDIQVKYASTVASWNNVSKNFDGQVEGFSRIDAREQKRREEAAVLAWLHHQGGKGRQALKAYRQLNQQQQQIQETQSRDWIVGQLSRTGTIGAAVNLYRLAIERQKPDLDREVGYQERDLATIEGSMRQMERRYVPQMDRQLQRYWLQQYQQLPVKLHLAALDHWLGSRDDAALDASLDRLANSQLGDTQTRLQLMKADRDAFEQSQDPAVQLAVALMPDLLAMDLQDKGRQGVELSARPTYLQALADYKKSQKAFVYPDANLSLRITFGHVTGYRKDGTTYTPFTTVQGVVAKETGADPFHSPRALIDAVKAKRYAGLQDPDLQSVPVDFLSDLDITGGNSGSPVLNASGQLVGLAFDGNWESVSSNWVFDPKMTRTIAVDQRYLQWIMREVAPAPNLLKELDQAHANPAQRPVE